MPTPESIDLSKILSKSLKIWANTLKIRAKMAPNVCRKIHEDLFLKVMLKNVFMIFVGENL